MRSRLEIGFFMKSNVKIKAGQYWRDKKTGDIMKVHKKHHDIYWNCLFERSYESHKMTEYVIHKYYTLIVDYGKTTTEPAGSKRFRRV